MWQPFWRDLRYRTRAIFVRRALEQELDAEVAEHLLREAEALERQGLSPAEARRRARLLFGGLDGVKEDAREARGTMLVESGLQDVRYAWRAVASRPAFAAGVAVTLALGIGANAAMFGVVDRLLFRAPAYLADVDRVHRIYLGEVNQGGEVAQRHFSIGTYLDIARETSSFQTLAAWATMRRAIGDGTATAETTVTGATAGYFDLFHAQPVKGRFFDAAEDRLPTGVPVAVLGYAYWQAAFGGADVLGQSLRIGATRFTIVGVAPRAFTGMEDTPVPAVYVPFASFVWDSRPEDHVADYHWRFLQLAAKRQPGVTTTQATADLTAAVNRSWLESGRSEADRAKSNPRGILGPVQLERGPLTKPDTQVAAWVSGVAAIVLLIAVANVANLLLARAVSRGPEIAMRLALGVSYGRLTRQLLMETALLAFAGGGGGLLLARLLGTFVSTRVLASDASPTAFGDGRTAVIIVCTTAAAALTTGIAPVLHARRTRVAQALGAGGRHTDGRTSRIRTWLLAIQVALSVCLLIGAGLFVRSLERARDLHLGYDASSLVVVSEHRRGNQRSPGAAWSGVEERITVAASGFPGAVSASPVLTVPFWGFEGHHVSTDELGPEQASSLGNFIMQAGTPDYFRTMGTRVFEGRGFADTDRTDGPHVVVVSGGMGRTLWPGRRPIGQCLYIHDRPEPVPCSTVVGIVEDTHVQALDDSQEFMYYVPLTQSADNGPAGTVMVRVTGRADAIADALAHYLQRSMPADGYVTAVPLSDMVGAPMRSWRIGATMFLAFGALALVVAAVGLYSVVAFGVVQRTREIAIRLALGATRQSVVGLVLRGGLFPVIGSVGAGCGLALAAGRWVAPLLFHVSPYDPLVYGGVAVILFVVAVIAIWVPARAATTVDPNRVLRME